ncbi:MAG: hypothetical protein AAF934_04600, partial [Bacteroidota bacterium]
MIQQKTTKTTIDKTLQKDVEQTGQLLKQLARQINAEPHIRTLVAQKSTTSGKEIVHAEMVFLTEKQEDNTAIQRLKNWLGFKKQGTKGDFFSGKISGNITIGEALSLTIQLYHFDHYPVRRLSETKKTLKIIVYDPSYEAHYKNRDLARELLAKDASVCLLLNIQPITEMTEEHPLKIEGLYTQYLHLGDLGTSITAIFEEETLYHKIRVAGLRNHIHDMDKVYQLLLQDIKTKTQQLQGKAMVTHKKQWQHQQKDTGITSRDVTHLKTAINNSLKQLTKAIEQAVDNFDKEDEHYITVEQEIQSFSGFVERKSGKYLSFYMAEGAVQDKVNKANTALKCFFEETTRIVNERFQETATDIKNQLHIWKLPLPEQTALRDNIDPQHEEFLMDNTVASGKSYEKQVPAKGIGSLLMELRTPLFMLMPIMMIVALFGALVKENSTGEISAVLDHNGKRCIAITQLPESWSGPNDFISEVEKKRGKGHFSKDISDGEEIIREAQLATLTETFSDSRGMTKVIETVDAYVDVNADPQVIYLYLQDNADYDHVVGKLKDPAAKLLVAPSSRSGGGMGIGKIIRVMSSPGLKNFKSLILIGLVA